MRTFLPRFRRKPTHSLVVEQTESQARVISATLRPSYLVAGAGPQALPTLLRKTY
jgi:hypothetical protein